jgi:hypothetical protein
VSQPERKIAFCFSFLCVSFSFKICNCSNIFSSNFFLRLITFYNHLMILGRKPHIIIIEYNKPQDAMHPHPGVIIKNIITVSRQAIARQGFFQLHAITKGNPQPFFHYSTERTSR